MQEQKHGKEDCGDPEGVTNLLGIIKEGSTKEVARGPTEEEQELTGRKGWACAKAETVVCSGMTSRDAVQGGAGTKTRA